MPRSRRKKTSKKLTLKDYLPILLIVIGLVLLMVPLATKNIASAQSNPIKIKSELLSKKDTREVPIRILVPKYKVDLPIIEAKVVNGLWELSETTASHGVGSANPGDKGNIVVFAHARDDLFGPIRYIQKDDEIYLLTKDKWHKYKVEETKLVDPSEVKVIAPTKKETLTLYTCSGFLDSKRLIVVAKPS